MYFCLLELDVVSCAKEKGKMRSSLNFAIDLSNWTNFMGQAKAQKCPNFQDRRNILVDTHVQIYRHYHE